MGFTCFCYKSDVLSQGCSGQLWWRWWGQVQLVFGGSAPSSEWLALSWLTREVPLSLASSPHPAPAAAGLTQHIPLSFTTTSFPVPHHCLLSWWGGLPQHSTRAWSRENNSVFEVTFFLFMHESHISVCDSRSYTCKFCQLLKQSSNWHLLWHWSSPAALWARV